MPELGRVLPFVDGVQWWGRPFQLGRRPFDSALSPVWRAWFEADFPLADPQSWRIVGCLGGVPQYLW